MVVLAVRSISEAKRVRYLLDLSSPAERERIESEYFEDDDAYQEMLITQNDLIDAYVRGELTSEERRRFEKSFMSSSRGRGRVQFAHAFAAALSGTGPVETKFSSTFLNIFKPFQSLGPLRTATIATVIVFAAILAWLIIDRRGMVNELHELRAESAELGKRTERLQERNDAERTRAAEITAQLSNLRTQLDKQSHLEGETTTGQRVRHLPEVKKDRETIAISKPEQPQPPINTRDASLGNTLESIRTTQLKLNARNVPPLLTLEPGKTRGGYVAGGRSDQANLTLDGVDVMERPLTHYLVARNMKSSGGTTFGGTIKDANGNVVSGATVTLSDSARIFTRTQSANKDGAYVFNAIPPGTYSLEVKAPGFKTSSASGLAVLVDTSSVLDMQLEVGAVSEKVDVTLGAEALINSSNASLGNSFERKHITELPLIANNVPSLLSLQPAVSSTGFVNGRRTDQSNITLDAVDATIRIPSSLSWITFQTTLKAPAIHEGYRVTIETTKGGRLVSIDWIEPLTPNQTVIETPVILTSHLPPGDYVFLLMGKEPDGSFVKVAEYAFKVVRY